jgi:2-oxoglutarate dehydrogenase E2 component (dihydrolipoamide succinyltransferase)
MAMAEFVDVRIPEDQREGTELELGTWLKKVGDRVELNEPIAELVTDKAVVEIPAPVSGVLREILIEAETAVDFDTILARIEVGAEGVTEAPGPDSGEGARTRDEGSSSPAVSSPSAEPTSPAPVGTAGGMNEADLSDRPAAHPSVVRFARANGIPLARVAGTGRGGRVTRADLWTALGRGPLSEAVGTAAPAERAGSVDRPMPPIEGPSRKIRHDPMRRTIARNMRDSVLVAPHVTAVFECDLSRVIADRERRKASLAKAGVKLTFSAYFLRATVEAIRAVPEVNSRWHDDGLEIFESIHVGVGTALEDRGLVVPVVRNAQDLDLDASARALTELTEKARAGKLTAEDMRGSTFTISNHGVMGSLIASPVIIQQPESAILGVGKLEKRAKVVSEQGGDDRLEIRPMMYVTLTIDHRVLDAFHTNRFLNRFCEVLETWS